jgi:hypothetical protein
MSFTGILILLFGIFSGLMFLLLICACVLNALKPTPRPQFLTSPDDLAEADPEKENEPTIDDYPPVLSPAPGRGPAIVCPSGQLASHPVLAKSVSAEPAMTISR